MKILVANIGSTSFKYRLYDMGDAKEALLASGSVERIGSSEARIVAKTDAWSGEQVASVADHARAVELALAQLTDSRNSVLADANEVAAIGFKAVHSRDFHGVHRVDAALLESMEAYASVAPAHNPPYVTAMRSLAARFPSIPLIAAFETDFHATIPEANTRYAVPDDWATRLGIRRWGFHGASHRYISWRVTELMGRRDLKLISCHLGGSSSLCAIRAGRSVACSLGFSPQSGLPHNNRAGDFDAFALPVLMQVLGLSLDEVLARLANQSGLEGLCGLRDLRDIEAASRAGDVRARLALDVFAGSIRHYLGAYLFELGGADAIVFTGGIGENSALIRERVLADLSWFGIGLDTDKNNAARGDALVSTETSRVQVWAVPTNEEIVVARQTRELMRASETIS